MKKSLFYGIIFSSVYFLNYINVISQDLTVHSHDAVITDTLGSEMIFALDLINNSNQELSVTIVRSTNDLPDGWSSSLCFDNCFAPFLDSISTSSDFGSSPLGAGETREISLHVFPAVNEGTGNVKIHIRNEFNLSESYAFDITANSTFTSVEDNSDIIDYKLVQNYPNPFNPSTNILYTINPTGESTEYVSLKVFDILGREVASLVDEYQKAGNYSVIFNSNNLTSGIYFYELKTENYYQIKKMILEK